MLAFPLVTVYITTFNRLSLLKRAVESVRNQDYENVEIIIVDDCSTDKTFDYLESIAKSDSRIRFFINEKNSGACRSRNVAIKNARGEFITGLDDDDFFLPNRISEFLDRWKRIQVSTVALTSSVTIKYPNTTRSIRRPHVVKKEQLFDNGNFVGNQVFTRTEYLRKIGGFDEQMPIMQDYECWLRLLGVHGNATIETTREKTYIVDVSHPHERISHNRLGKLVRARELIFNKHDLTELEKEIFSIEIEIAARNRVPLSLFVRKILRNPMSYNIKGTLGLFLRNYFPSKFD